MNKQVGEKSNVVSVKYTNAEFDLLRSTFQGNPEILKALKKALLQQELKDKEKEALATQIKGEDLKRILQKVLNPTIEDDVNIEWIEDKYDLIGSIHAPLKVRTAENGALAIKSRCLAVKYFEQEFENLFGSIGQNIKFKELEDDSKEDKELYINFVAREEIIERLKGFLDGLRKMAETKNLTEEELIAAQKKNSAK